MAAGLLVISVIAGSSAEEYDTLKAISPLYDYRYSSAAEDMGLLSNGTSESKLGFESIQTASLSPKDDCQGKECRLTIKQADSGGTSSDTCSGTCSPSCGLNSCYDAGTCGDTCLGTSCEYTCADTCQNTCEHTCAASCADTCFYTCSNTCYSTCSQTCASTCAQTCSATCSEACAAPKTPLANSTTEEPPYSEQSLAVSYEPGTNPPKSAYYRGNSITWPQFAQTFNGDRILAWSELSDNTWGTFASAPLGSWVRRFVYVPVSGNLIQSVESDLGKTSMDYGYTTPGFKYVWFYAGQPGDHSSIFSINDQRSNEVTIAVF